MNKPKKYDVLRLLVRTCFGIAVVAHLQVQPHPKASFMKEKYISDHLDHDAFTSCCAETVDDSGSEKAPMGFCQSFPYCRSTGDDSEQKQGCAASKYV